MFLFGLRNLRFRTITFVLYGLVSIFSVPSRLIQQDSTFAFFLLCLSIGALITTIALPILWAVCFLNQKFKLGQRNVFYPLSMVLIAGTLRGIILQELIAGFGLRDNLEPIFAVFSSTIFTFVYFTVISSFMESVLQRREKFDQVFAEASLLLVNPQSVADEKIDPRLIYTSTLSRIKESLSPYAIEKDQVKPEDLMAASKAIQEEINEVLRPLSHRLWVNGLGRVKHRNIFGILRESIENLDFHIINIVTYQFFIGGYGISLVLGLKSAIYVSSIGVLTSLALMVTYRIIIRHIPNRKFFIGSTFLILVGLLPVYLPIYIRNPLNNSVSALAGLLVVPTLPVVILLLSSYTLVIRDRDLAIGAASSIGWRIASNPILTKDGHDGIELAEYFHNSLQSELFGIAKRLETISTKKETGESKEIVKSLKSVLNRDYMEISSRDMDGVMRIQNIVTSWQGIAEIEISGLESLEKNSNIAYRASQVIEEMITNTIRYGEANMIYVEIEIEPMTLRILLTHNGRGEISRKSGLGSLILSQHSESGVKIDTEEGKTFLRISLPTN